MAARCFADGGYAGGKPRDALPKVGKWTVEIIKRSDVAKGFVVLPRRWVVERTWHGSTETAAYPKTSSKQPNQQPHGCSPLLFSSSSDIWQDYEIAEYNIESGSQTIVIANE